MKKAKIAEDAKCAETAEVKYNQATRHRRLRARGLRRFVTLRALPVLRVLGDLALLQVVPSQRYRRGLSRADMVGEVGRGVGLTETVIDLG